MPINWFYDRDIKDAGDPSPRQQLVEWWDELFEEHGDDYSLQMNIKKINEILDYEKYVIISDIRYPVEFDWIEQNDITLLNIQRDVEATIDHVTESGTTKGIMVDNNGTIEELKSTIIDLFKSPESII